MQIHTVARTVYTHDTCARPTETDPNMTDNILECQSSLRHCHYVRKHKHGLGVHMNTQTALTVVGRVYGNRGNTQKAANSARKNPIDGYYCTTLLHPRNRNRNQPPPAYNADVHICMWAARHTGFNENGYGICHPESLTKQSVKRQQQNLNTFAKNVNLTSLNAPQVHKKRRTKYNTRQSLVLTSAFVWLKKFLQLRFSPHTKNIWKKSHNTDKYPKIPPSYSPDSLGTGAYRTRRIKSSKGESNPQS